MSWHDVFAVASFALVCTALLFLPFAPAWREWRRPSDYAPLPVPTSYSNDVDHFANEFRGRILASSAQGEPPPMPRPGAVYAVGDFQAPGGSSHSAILAGGRVEVGPGSRITEWAHADQALRLGEASVGLRRISSDQAVELDRGCCFERVHAPVIRFGRAGRASYVPIRGPAEPREMAHLPGARRWAEGVWRVEGNCAIPVGGSYRGSLVVTGTLAIGAGSIIAGDVKARKGMLIGAGARVLGSVISPCAIHLLQGAAADGPVISEAEVLLSCGARVGRADAPTTISAVTIIVETGSVAHGTVWARRTGVVWGHAS